MTADPIHWPSKPGDKDAAVINVAVPVPLRKSFAYSNSAGGCNIEAGIRVRVPFGRQTLVGLVLPKEIGALPEKNIRLKTIKSVLDEQALIPPDLLQLILWASRYYQHPIGEVVAAALPKKLRDGSGGGENTEIVICLTASGHQATPDLRRAPRQRQLLEFLQQQVDCQAPASLLRKNFKSWRIVVRRLQEKSWVVEKQLATVIKTPSSCQPGPVLTAQQQKAADCIGYACDHFQTWVLHGVTGSGKTEVYLHLIQQQLRQNRQVLVLIPEIALTPQLEQRFRARLPAILAVLHSGLNDSERLNAWQVAASGKAGVVLGTRSAVFTPLPEIGLIIIDEEHDLAFKQQDGFRYHARDVAIKRASDAGVPIILGSATPSLETMKNVYAGRYELLHLANRIQTATLPDVRLIDTTKLRLKDGLTPHLLEAIEQRLQQQQQCILFINRRGFSPVLLCAACGWMASCQRCESRLTYHQHDQRLRCHHCGSQKAAPAVCPGCGHDQLYNLGEGTQRLELALQRHFPQARILRVDRDTIQRRGELEKHLQQIADHQADLIVGTQLLSKGHDFPKVTLVGIINADQRLFSLDFRAGEHLFQQLTQVSGRAGRHRLSGEVIIQTAFPNHPYFDFIRRHDYRGFVASTLAEREESCLPPYRHLAMFRAEAATAEAPLKFLQAIKKLGTRLNNKQHPVQIFDPISAPMAKRAGRYRAQLLLQSRSRKHLGFLLQSWINQIPELGESRLARWSIDVDPMDMY